MRSVLVHLVAADGSRIEAPALSASLRLETGLLQMLPPGEQDFVSVGIGRLESRTAEGVREFGLTEGFASFGKGELTVMVRGFEEDGA